MTLMLNKWPSKNSNLVLESTCVKGAGVFGEIYDRTKNSEDNIDEI